MFKFLIILNILGLIIIGTSSKEEATRNCSEVPIPWTESSYDAPLQFYHLVIKCANDLIEKMNFQDQPFKQCIWLKNLEHCLDTFKENENVDCNEEIKKMIRDLENENTAQNRFAPECLWRFVNKN